jgi:hypothetical protein
MCREIFFTNSPGHPGGWERLEFFFFPSQPMITDKSLEKTSKKRIATSVHVQSRATRCVYNEIGENAARPVLCQN